MESVERLEGSAMENTVVILGAGIGAMTIGFQKAGCKVIAAYEKDKKAIELYRKNIDDRVLQYEDIGNINPQSLPDADIFAGSIFGVSSLSSVNKRDTDCLAVISAVISDKRPKMVCLAFPKRFIHKQNFEKFKEYIMSLGYSYGYAGISTVRTTGLPIAGTEFYFVASLSSISKKMEFPGGDIGFIYPVEEICEEGEVDEWYYRVDYRQVEEKSQEDTFLCWKNGRYVETELADTNLFKIPLVRMKGRLRKITHQELARLKGFPSEVRMEVGNKAWLYKQLVYSPNVEVAAQLAKTIMNMLCETPLQKTRAIRGNLFHKVFEKYLEKKGADFEKKVGEPTNITNSRFDFPIRNQASRIKFVLKIYNSDYALAANLKHACESFQDTSEKKQDTFILVVGNVVESSVKENLRKQFDVFIWDVQNLLWMFEEYPDIRNEFISLLSYSIDEIEPKAPVPNLFEETCQESQENDRRNKLLSLETGRENFQKYEELCTEILRYVLGDYLSLWATQEKSNDGLYRFDLCCKIKNGVNQDFFNTIQNYFHTKYIVFEFKNYAEKISQKEIYTTEKYLYEKALRSVAIIVSRQGADENALSATRGCLRENGKLILCLSDNDLLELIDIKDKDEQPTAEYFEAVLDDLLIHLEK